jgi:uncharacterized protein YukJ
LPIHNYGVLKGRAVARVVEHDARPHYHIHLRAARTDFRVAVSVRSRHEDAPELLFYVAENFRHPMTSLLEGLPEGFHALARQPDGMALDYIRGNLLDRRKMIRLPYDLPGAENDLNDKMEMYVRRAIGKDDVIVYAFGSRWGPEMGRADEVFGFRPGNGIHNIHMNQGNPPGDHDTDNGVYQDGALLLHCPAQERWIAIFLAFQTQAWHTGDRTGYPLTKRGSDPEYRVRIVAAMVNPRGEDAGHETVTLLNGTAETVDLRGWKIADLRKRQVRLTGLLAPGEALTVRLPPYVRLDNEGGLITLLDPAGLKVHGVAYTRRQAEVPGRPITF